MKSPVVSSVANAIKYVRMAKDLAVDLRASKWMVVGYLSEVEWSVAGLSLDLMSRVREVRHKIERDEAVADFDILVLDVEGVGDLLDF